MARAKDSTVQRAWYVLGPLALILIGVGWLALGLAGSRAMRVRSLGVLTGGTDCGTLSRAPTDDDRHPVQRWRRNHATGSYYRVIRAGTWRKAQASAAGLGGRLVTVDDAQEQAWLVENFGGTETFWIGLTDANTEGRWRWAGGEPVSYTNWAEDEPNNLNGENYGVMNWLAPGVWNDMSAASAKAADVRRAIVERSAGLVDSGHRGRNGAPNARDISGKPITALSDFAAGLPEAMAFDTGLGDWTRWLGVDRSGSHRGAEIVWDEGLAADVIQFTRVGGRATGSTVGIARDVHIDLADYGSLQLAMEVKPMTQRLGGGGWVRSGEYPVTIELAYLDQNGAPHTWQHGFYFKGDARWPDSSKIPGGEWHSYASPRLSTLMPTCVDGRRRADINRHFKSRVHAHDSSSRPAVITRVAVFGGGWDFSGRAANLRFAEGAQLARGQ